MWDRVEAEDGKEAERNPCCLCHESAEKPGRLLLDLVEAGIATVGDDALE